MCCFIFILFTNKNSNYVSHAKMKVETPHIMTKEEKQEKVTNELTQLIDEYIIKNGIDKNVAVKVQDLVSGGVYTHNEDVNFIAASIYKLPLVVAYYDLIEEGKYSLSDKIIYQENYIENYGPIEAEYKIGDSIEIEKLLHYAIIYSDNTAAHMLFENLGGWLKYKELVSKYSKQEVDKSFYTYDNVYTAKYISDVLEYVYENSDKFDVLLNDMMEPSNFMYLSEYVNVRISQKYGMYLAARNSAGIVHTLNPYSIVVFTSLGDEGIEHIGRINEICYDYFKETRIQK